ncbi:hypothetical protein evm_013236 [Chilo suppressalis]|nr:hypothetical protein evm_013236 [Chilo suppressalis]
MNNNLENERSVTTGKMYPIDLAPQKITIVKSVSNAEVKMAHLITGQPKTSNPGQIIAHTGPVGLMRPAAQIISPSVASKSQMIVSGSPILQGTQGSQLLSPSTQIISQSQLISPSGQILSPATQIISQGSQLSAQVSNNSTGTNNAQTSATSAGATQVLNVGGQLVGGSGNLVVSSSVRTLPPSVRVLSPLPHHNTRPVLSSVNVSTSSGVLVNKSIGMTSHVPRGLAAGASLAVRPVTPTASQGVGGQGAWSSATRGARGALVYGARTTTPRAPGSRPVTPTGLTATATHPASVQPSLTTQSPHAVVSMPSTTVLTSSGVISGTVRGPAPRLQAPAPTSVVSTPRPLPLLQRNYQPKVVGVASVGVRGVVGNSAPAQLYYEVPRAAAPPPQPHTLAPRPIAYGHAPSPTPLQPTQPPPQQPTQPQPTPSPQAPHSQPMQVNNVPVVAETRAQPSGVQNAPVVPRPSILRKRDIEGSPTKATCAAPVGPPIVPVSSSYRENTGWEDIPGGGGGPGSGGSTTISASSSPAPDDEPDPPRNEDVSPRKKPRKQLLTNEVRQCEYTPDETPPTPSPVTVNPPPKRPLLSSGYVCGWRSTALHFTRPSDVRRREPRAKDILAIASQRHVLTSAEGWKLHHLTAQMDALVSLEEDVGEQLASLLRALETASGRTITALQPHSHSMLELLKGNIQRSKIVCEGIQEAREDILRVFTHRNFVSEILTRQADKRCFRKHRSQS